MTVERPIDLAHAWFINGIETPIDLYINYSDEPGITDLKPLEPGTEYQVKGKDDTPYGTYTFSAREKGRPHSEVLAAVSIDFSEGRSFTAVFHQLPDRTHRFSVYENDFTPSDAPRMTVRHTARPAPLTWTIEPKEFKIEIPRDARQGTLDSGQWQVAKNVVQNDYRLEVLLDDQLVAEHPDLELEHEKDTTVYIVGDPYPTEVTGTLRRFVVEQEFKLPRGAPPAAGVTPPAEPYATTDRNLRIEFECGGVKTWQTNPTRARVSAVDPDGVITDLSVASISPEVGGILIPDHGVAAATSIGGRASAAVHVLGDVPPGAYEVTIATNTQSQGERATCTVSVEVLPITVERVQSVAAEYARDGATDPEVHTLLADLLEHAAESLELNQREQACEQLKDAVALVGSEKDQGIDVDAAEHMERELKALRSNLGCG